MLREFDEHLNDQERSVLLLVALGYHNELIADYLKLRVQAVESHRIELCRKLGIGDARNLDTMIAASLSQSKTPQ